MFSKIRRFMTKTPVIALIVCFAVGSEIRK